MEVTPVLERFFRTRSGLMEALTATERAVDEWYEHNSASAGLRELALLEGLLAERRNFLDRLMKLDDDMLTQLLLLRSAADGAR
jgi:hypothetical protein